MSVRRRRAALPESVADPDPRPPVGRLVIHDQRPGVDDVTVLLYAHDKSEPVGQITVARELLTFYAHRFLEAGLNLG